MLTLSALAWGPLKVRDPFWWNRWKRFKIGFGWALACNLHRDLQIWSSC